MARTPFGVEWEDLTLDVLREFLAERPEETITWEGKSMVTRRTLRGEVCGFANSNLGGYLVIGVEEKKDHVWEINGFEFPTEAAVWVSDCLASGNLQPRPAFDCTPGWEVAPGRQVAVVRVFPVSLPPCITVDGGIYERLPGKTSLVKDSASLRRLFERGEAARQRAQVLGDSARNDMWSMTVGRAGDGRSPKVVVALGPTSLPPDASASVFRESTSDAMRSVVLELTAGSRPPGYPIHPRNEASQHAMTEFVQIGEYEAVVVRIGRFGAVAIGLFDPDIDDGLQWAKTRVDLFVKYWRAAIDLIGGLGPPGEAFMAIRLGSKLHGATDLGRWVTSDHPTDTEIANVIREVHRASGEWAWEPEPTE